MKESIFDKIESKIVEKKYRKIKKEKPDSRIWQRPISYSMARHQLAKALKAWEAEDEKIARIDYLVEKTAANEKLTDSEKEFILSLSKEDLDNFIKLLRYKLMEFVEWIRASWSMDADELDPWDVNGFFAINKMYDFIRENRKWVRVYRYIFGSRYQLGKYWTISGDHWLFYEE